MWAYDRSHFKSDNQTVCWAILNLFWRCVGDVHAQPHGWSARHQRDQLLRHNLVAPFVFLRELCGAQSIVASSRIWCVFSTNWRAISRRFSLVLYVANNSVCMTPLPCPIAGINANAAPPRFAFARSHRCCCVICRVLGHGVLCNLTMHRSWRK